MITAFDMIDACLVAAVIVTAIAYRAWWARWAIGGLALYHVLGRAIAWNLADPLAELALLQLGVAAGYLFGPLLSLYGRAVGTIFAVMSLSSLYASLDGSLPPLGEGLGFDLWNFQSVCLDAVAVLMILGVMRHYAIVRMAGPGADRRL